MSRFNWAAYSGFDGRCDGKAHDGTRALLAYLQDRFPWGASLGIYNCRPPSVHGDGRALDFRIPTGPGGAARPELGNQVVELLGPHGARLGIATLIYNRIIYSQRAPDGRPYTGPHPHKDHTHTDQTPASGMNLTYATLVAVLGPVGATPAPVPVEPATASGPPFPKGAELLPGGGYGPESMVGKPADGHVTIIQQRLNLHLKAAGGMLISEDGKYGPKTFGAVQWFQKGRFGATSKQVDGVVGPVTWRELWK